MNNIIYIIDKNLSAEELRELINSKGKQNKQIAFCGSEYTDPRVNDLVNLDVYWGLFYKTDRQVAQTIVKMATEGKIKKGAKNYSAILTYLDSVIDKHEAENQTCCKCMKGCDGCCKNNMITIGYPEAEVIKEHLESSAFTRKLRTMVLKRIEEQASIVVKEGFTTAMVTAITNSGNSEKETQMRKRYHALHLPCVFLYEGRCLIHEVRPLDCWGFRQYVSSCYCEGAFDVAGSYEFSESIRILVRYLTKEYHSVEAWDSIPGMMKKILLQ